MRERKRRPAPAGARWGAAPWLAATAAVAVSFAPLAGLEFDSDRWLPEDHPEERALDALEREFTPGETLAVVVETPEGAFSREATERIEALEDTLAGALGEAFVSIRSPASAERIAAQGNQVRIESYARSVRQGRLAWGEAYRESFRGGPYGGRLADDAGRYAMILARLGTHEDAEARMHAMARVREALERSGEGENVHLAGGATLREAINERVRTQTPLLIAAAAVTVALFLVAALGSIARALPVIAIAGAAIGASLGWVMVLGHKMTVTTMALPVIVAVIAVADALHVIARRDRARERGSAPEKAGKGAISAAFKPCLMTTVTSMVGFGAFAASTLVPLRHFGIDAGAAIASALALIVAGLWLTFRFEPQGMELPQGRGKVNALLRAAVEACHAMTSRRPGAILAGAAAVTIALGAGAATLRTETSFLQVFFARDSTIRADFGVIDEHLGGTGSIDIVVDGGARDWFKTMPGLAGVASLQDAVEGTPNARGTRSYAHPVRETHAAFTGRDMLPETPDELAQEMLFLELSRSETKDDVLSPYMDFESRTARIEVQVPDLGQGALGETLGYVREAMKRTTGGAGLGITLTGFSAFVHSMGGEVLATQVLSLGITIAAVGAICIIGFGLARGLLAGAVAILPVVGTLGAMAWLKVPIDFSTVMVAGVTLGLGIDDAVHLLHAYHRSRKTNPPAAARREAVALAGKPILTTTALFMAGFAVLLLSDLVIVQRLAAFTMIGLALALGASLVVLPAALAKSDGGTQRA